MIGNVSFFNAHRAVFLFPIAENDARNLRGHYFPVLFYSNVKSIRDLSGKPIIIPRGIHANDTAGDDPFNIYHRGRQFFRENIHTILDSDDIAGFDSLVDSIVSPGLT